MKILNWIYLAIAVLFLGVMYFVLKKLLALINPSGTAAWWGGFFGLSKPGTKVPDLTGQAGQNASDQAQAAAVAAVAPQLQYDQARSTYMKNRGLSPAWDDATGAGWPWHSYDDWYAAGMPTLPT